MFKKLFIASAILAATGSAFAGAPYVGVGTGVIVNTSNFANFRGFPGIIMAGYGGTLGEGFYLGGEVFGNIGTATITDNGLKSTYAYGLSVLPGILISDHTMGYARFGIVRTHFTPGGGTDSNVSGLQFGLGMQTSLTQNWDLRGEYTFTADKSVSGVSGNPRTDAATVSLIYKFD
jgi:opacity protein-like surface antigen